LELCNLEVEGEDIKHAIRRSPGEPEQSAMLVFLEGVSVRGPFGPTDRRFELEREYPHCWVELGEEIHSLLTFLALGEAPQISLGPAPLIPHDAKKFCSDIQFQGLL
jgi:hypothetical protein